MAGNESLRAARNAKQDEFYTQYEDIQKEMKHYRQHFAGKTVLCNCDDPFESNFFKYFALAFNKLGLKKLIATSYDPSPIAGRKFRYRVNNDGQTSFLFGEEAMRVGEDDGPKPPYKAVVTSVHDATGNGGVEMVDIAELFISGENTVTQLKGDGDFRSPECLALLDEADIVVTNPPFSLFREYVATLMAHDKKFIIIGNKNAMNYKEIFPLLKENKIWTGYRGFSGGMWFYASYEGKTEKIVDGQKLINVPSIWYTNLDIKKRHEELILFRRYSPEKYPKYDNYDAINVDKTLEIPCDYAGIMGVPITFMDKYNPDQFEIIWQAERSAYANAPKEILERVKFDPSIDSGGGLGAAVLHGSPVYTRLLVRNKHPEQPKEVRSWR